MKEYLRYPAMAFAVGIGLCSIAATVCFGSLFAPGPERIIYGSIFGFLDASKLILPSVASFAVENGHKNRARIGFAIYAVLTLLSGAAHVGLYATVKSEVIGDAGAVREKYEAAKSEKKAVEADLANLGKVRPVGTIEAELASKRLDPRYARSQGCGDVTVNDSRALCGAIAALNGERKNAADAERLKVKLDEIERRLRGLDVAAALRSADPQAEQLAALTGMSQDSVRLWMAILLSIMIELGSSLLLDIAAITKRKDAPGDVGSREHNTFPIKPLAKREPKPEEGNVADWVKVALQAKRNVSVRCTEAREAFERSVRATGGTPPAPNAFGRQMTALGYRRKKKGGHFHYIGVSLCTQSLKVVSR